MAYTKGEATRNDILKKAAALFMERGYSAVTMKDICQATGLSRGGLYRHFSSTGEIISLIMVKEQEKASIDMEAMLTAGAGAEELLEAFLEVHRTRLLERESALEPAISEYALLNPRGKERLQERFNTAVHRTESIIRLGQAQGKFIDCDPRALAWQIILMITGMRTYFAIRDINKELVDQQISLLRNLILK